MTIGYYPFEEGDAKKLLMSGAHVGEKVANTFMKAYIHDRRKDRHYHFDLKKTWNLVQLCGRILAGIENPKDICAVSGSPSSHVRWNNNKRAVLKFALYTKCSSIAGKYTPGTLTNQIQKNYREPRIIVVSDPSVDHQVIVEAASMGIPVLAFCNSNNSLNFVDIAIPCNNKGSYAIGVMWWMLTREVLRFRQTIDRKNEWDIMVDMFFQRDQTAEENEAKTVEKEIEKLTIKEKTTNSHSFRKTPKDNTITEVIHDNEEIDVYN